MAIELKLEITRYPFQEKVVLTNSLSQRAGSASKLPPFILRARCNFANVTLQAQAHATPSPHILVSCAHGRGKNTAEVPTSLHVELVL